MGTSLISEDQKLWLLIGAIFVVAIIAFWPLMTVFVWAVALAVALMPLHQRLSRRVKPSLSALLITLGVLLAIMLLVSAATIVIYNEIDYTGTMVSTLVKGFASGLCRLPAHVHRGTALQYAPDADPDAAQHPPLTHREPGPPPSPSIILFLSLSMLIYYGEEVWASLTQQPLPKLSSAVARMSEITATQYIPSSLSRYPQPSSPFFSPSRFCPAGLRARVLFATMIGFSMLIPLIGAHLFLLFFILYMVSLGDIRSALITMFIGYPLLSGWIDFYYRPVMIKNGAVYPVFMIIGIFAGVPFMGIIGFHPRPGAHRPRSDRLYDLY